jgi:CheY-like chemotaxis protein
VKLKCIMLVDDDEPTNVLHKRVIEKAGVAEEVLIAYDGDEALEIFYDDSPPPELVFLDINMPRVNGWEFLEEYDKLPEEKKAQAVVVMLTTSLNPDDLERARNYNGVTKFLRKPLTVDMIHETIEKHLKR